MYVYVIRGGNWNIIWNSNFGIEKLEFIVESCPVIFIIFIMKIFIEDYQDLIFKGLIYLEIKFVKEDRSREEKKGEGNNRTI